MACPDEITLAPPVVLEVRPLEPEDRDAYLAAFQRLSARTRYLRFAASKPALSGRELRYLTEVDHHQHEALVAYEPSGEIVGLGRFVALAQEPEVAEVAVTLADDWQGEGLGPRLLSLLACRAQEEGIRRFRASVLSDNRPALKALRRLGFRGGQFSGGVVEMELALSSPPPQARRSSR